MTKIELMNEWLDKQEKHHRGLKEKNIKEAVFADAMQQIKSRLKNTGWDATFSYVSEYYDKGKDSQMVGPHALAMAYQKIIVKMKSLNMKEAKL